MATNLTGITGTGQGSTANNRAARVTNLETQIGQMQPDQARQILSTLEGKIGNRWGYLRLDGSGSGQEVGFTTRWNTNFFRSARGEVTGAALKALFEKAGYDTAALSSYLQQRGNRGIQLDQVRGFLPTNEVQVQGQRPPDAQNQPIDRASLTANLRNLCAGSLVSIPDWSLIKVQGASVSIQHQPQSNRHNYYYGQDQNLKFADQVLYLAEDSSPSEWADIHFSIFNNLEKLVNSSTSDPEFQGVVKRFRDFKDSNSNAFHAQKLKTELRVAAEDLAESAPGSPEANENFLRLLNQSVGDDLKHFLRPAPLAMHAGEAMQAIDSVSARQSSPEIQEIAQNMKNKLLQEFAQPVLEKSKIRVVDALPEIRLAQVDWMRGALETLRQENEDVHGISIPFSNFSEGVNLLLHTATELEKKGLLDERNKVSIQSIREKHESDNEVQQAISFVRDEIEYDRGHELFVFPLEDDKILTCNANGFTAWLTGKDPAKYDLNVWVRQNGKLAAPLNADTMRLEGLAKLPLFAKGLATLDTAIARSVVDQVILRGSDDDATRDLFLQSLSGRKQPLSVKQQQRHIEPIFARIWGEGVVSSITDQWDGLNLDAHFAQLKQQMPSEFGKDNVAYSKFLFNLSAVFTKLGSASIWGSESSSIDDLRLYGYLLQKEARNVNPNLLEGADWDKLAADYKNLKQCAQILSGDQLRQAKDLDPQVYQIIVPMALK